VQNLTIHTYEKKIRKRSPLNIGQNVYVIDYSLSKPVIIEGNILAIGICSQYQTDDLIYFIDRSLMKSEEFKQYYLRDIYLTKEAAIKNLAKELRKYIAKLEESANLYRK
jgi:hypothetical protein